MGFLRELLSVVASGALAFVMGGVAAFVLFPAISDYYDKRVVSEVLVLDLATLAAEAQQQAGPRSDDAEIVAGEMGRRLDIALRRLAERGVLVVDSEVAMGLPAGRVMTKDMVWAWSSERTAEQVETQRPMTTPESTGVTRASGESPLRW